jgi:hypothetical protein
MRNLVLGLLSLALLPPMYMGITTPVSAQEAKCFVIEDVVSLELSGPGFSSVVIAEPDAVKAVLEGFAANGVTIPDGVTRVLIYRYVDPSGDTLAIQYGFEVNGCLLPPSDWPMELLSPVGVRLSGAYRYGTFA